MSQGQPLSGQGPTLLSLGFGQMGCQVQHVTLSLGFVATMSSINL